MIFCEKKGRANTFISVKSSFKIEIQNTYTHICFFSFHFLINFVSCQHFYVSLFKFKMPSLFEILCFLLLLYFKIENETNCPIFIKTPKRLTSSFHMMCLFSYVNALCCINSFIHINHFKWIIHRKEKFNPSCR